jgi:hypothetical protein
MIITLAPDHLDMVRPPHEDPGLASQHSGLAAASRPAAKVRSFSGGNRFNHGSLLTTSQQQQPLTMPVTIAPSAVSRRETTILFLVRKR